MIISNFGFLPKRLGHLGILSSMLFTSVMSSNAQSAFTKEADPRLVINLISFDANHGDINARIQLKLPETEITKQFSPKHDFTLVDELTVTDSVLKIPSNVPYSAFNNFLITQYQVHDAGSQFYYPFDKHIAHLRIFVDSSAGTNSAGIVDEHVPVQLDTSLCSFEGYKINLTPESGNSKNYVHLQIELERALPIQLFTVFVSILMLLVSLGFMNLVRRLIKSDSVPDINELAFGAALLFAFPAIRSIQPFVPPMGVMSDFFGFFWAESIVAISLIVHLYWYCRTKLKTIS
jgi:hypothetical protein